jgi:hypothetical protein
VEAVMNYLAEMNVNKELGDAMFRVASDNVVHLRHRDLERMGLLGFDPAFAEWKAASEKKDWGEARYHAMRKYIPCQAGCGAIDR